MGLFDSIDVLVSSIVFVGVCVPLALVLRYFNTSSVFHLIAHFTVTSFKAPWTRPAYNIIQIFTLLFI